MIKKIDHIGIAVTNIEEKEKIYREGLGIEIAEKVTVPEQKARVAIMHVGEVKLELVEPISESSPIAGFLKKKGEGIHHICFEVEDIAAESARLKKAGMKIIESASEVGAGGTKVLFIHPSSTGSVLFELVEHPLKK